MEKKCEFFDDVMEFAQGKWQFYQYFYHLGSHPMRQNLLARRCKPKFQKESKLSLYVLTADCSTKD